MGSIAAKQHRPRMRIRTRQDIVGTNNKNRDEDAASRTRNAEARSHTHQRRNVDKTRARRGFANLCGHPRPWPQQCRLKVWSALPSVGLIICGKVNTHKLSWSLLTKPSSLGATIRGGGVDMGNGALLFCAQKRKRTPLRVARTHSSRPTASECVL